MEGTLPSEHDPRGTFTPVNLASELKVQVRPLARQTVSSSNHSPGRRSHSQPVRVLCVARVGDVVRNGLN